MPSMMSEALARRKQVPEKEEAAPEAVEEHLEAEESEDSELLELAKMLKDNPQALEKVKELLSENQEEKKGLVEEAAEEGAEDEADSQLLSGLSDYDKESLVNGEPKSLNERAMKGVLLKKKS